MNDALRTWKMLKLPPEAVNSCDYCAYASIGFRYAYDEDLECQVFEGPCGECERTIPSQSNWEWDEDYT